MSRWQDFAARPRRLGIIAATLATGLGIAVMAAGGAPVSYAIVNAAALVIGMALLAIVLRQRGDNPRPEGGFILAAAAGLLATAMLGITIDGAARWVRIGAVSLQPGLILLPVMIVAFARRTDGAATLGMIVAALALALQPDRAMAGTLVAGLAVVAVQQPNRQTLVALAAAIGGFCVTLLRPDVLPATAFVEHVVIDAFALSAIAGGALVTGAMLLILPALARSDAAPVFAITWIAILVAALLGNYPTPLLGYGGSGIIGYLLSLAALPPRVGTARDETGAEKSAPPRADDRFEQRAPAGAN
jgi:cell division protein FtsW (lipid II flippase)